MWVDDDLWPEELDELEKHEAQDNFFMIDLTKDPDQLLDVIDRL